MTKTLTASDMGKLSAAARQKKFKIKDWSKHMKGVRKGKKLTNARKSSKVSLSTQNS